MPLRKDLDTRLSSRRVGRFLNDAGSSLQGNRKTLEGASHPDRNAQFLHVSRAVVSFQDRGQPMISATPSSQRSREHSQVIATRALTSPFAFFTPIGCTA